MLTPLDEALIKVQNHPENQETLENQYYDLFLNATLFVPTWGIPDEDIEETLEEDIEVQPVIMTMDEINYIMIFDNQKRLEDFVKEQKVGFVELSGFDIINIFGSENHLMLNGTSEYAKEFVPEEIEWLKANVSNS